MSFRREALDKVRFDMKLNEGAAVNFETDLCLQIKKMGYAILFDRKIQIAHYNAPRQIAERRDDKTLYSNQYSHNYVYLALKHFNYLQKCAFLIYFCSIGQKVAPGIGLYLWYALKRDPRKRLYWSSNAGKARGVISYVNSVRRNEQ